MRLYVYLDVWMQHANKLTAACMHLVDDVPRVAVPLVFVSIVAIVLH